MPLEKIVDYIFKQIGEIRQGGRPVFFRKVKRRASILLFVPLAMPVIIIVRLLYPFITIRFGILIGGRIGHFASNTELYLCARDAGIYGKKTYDVFYISLPVSNYQLKKMWERTMPISRYVEFLCWANRYLPGYERHQVPSSDVDIHILLGKTLPHLSFTEEEERIGKKELQKMGLPDDMPFFCFIGRDPAYLNGVHGKNYDYHNYRNMDIKNFIPAVKELTQKGYFTIRMGSVVEEPLKITDSRYIDYATKYRTDFLDIYLCEKCHFFVNGMAGLDGVPRVLFRKPIVQVNYIPILLYQGSSSKTIFIPKKLWHVKDRRFMTFRESFEAGIGRIFHTEQYKQAGIEPIENTPDEITAVVNEMEERLRGVWQTTDEVEELQQRFNTLFQTYKKDEELNSQMHIGAEFLRQNVELLE